MCAWVDGCAALQSAKDIAHSTPTALANWAQRQTGPHLDWNTKALGLVNRRIQLLPDGQAVRRRRLAQVKRHRVHAAFGLWLGGGRAAVCDEVQGRSIWPAAGMHGRAMQAGGGGTAWHRSAPLFAAPQAAAPLPLPHMQVVVECGVVGRRDEHAVALIAQRVNCVVNDGGAACSGTA